MGQESICGLATINPTCQEIIFKSVPALDFQVWFIQSLSDLCQHTKPTLSPSLFEPKELGDLKVTIVPLGLANLGTEGQNLSSSFTFRINLQTSNTNKVSAYANLLKIATTIINYIEVLAKRKSLTFTANLGIVNSAEANIALTLNKRL
jgi:hypothetical protein